jgi:hypothetical protein
MPIFWGNTTFIGVLKTPQNKKIKKYIYIIPPHWWLHLIVVRRFEYACDPERYTSGSVATDRASLAGQVKGYV